MEGIWLRWRGKGGGEGGGLPWFLAESVELIIHTILCFCKKISFALS